MLRLLRIVHPRNTKLSFPRLKSTNRVFAGCSVRPTRFITSPIRRSASLARDSVPHSATKSSAYWIPPASCWRHTEGLDPQWIPLYYWDMRSDPEMHTPNQKLLLAPIEVAQRLSLGRATIYEMIASKELAAIRVGRVIRVPQKEIERWVEANINAVQEVSKRSTRPRSPELSPDRSSGLRGRSLLGAELPRHR